MKYNNNWLKERYLTNEIEYVFFYGHTSSKKIKTTKTCLSQWFERKFNYEEIEYKTAEQWMMAQKAQLFKDEECYTKIIKSDSPKEAKALGRKVRGFDEFVWKSKRIEIVQKGNYLKFKQNADLWNFLDKTENKVLVEASSYDKIWGIGMKADDAGIKNPRNWKGLNLLGYVLMEVRDKLRQEWSEPSLIEKRN